jgi:hypothetical protein
MNCDECKEQVFELIEREAVDPGGVRELLARCPDCRAAFDEMKAALEVAGQLPIEEPSAAVDAAIVRAANERVPRPVPLRKRRLQPPPWAMAAIAVLAVGVGVWSIPREVQLEGDAAPADMKSAEAPIMAEQERDEVEEALDDSGALAEVGVLGSERTGHLGAAPRGEARVKRASSKPAPAKRRSRLAAENKEEVQAPASLPAADMAAGAAPEAFEARKQQQDDRDGATADCQRKVDDIERRTRSNKGYSAKPEELLAIGKCYQMLDSVAEARRWLHRATMHRKTKERAEDALRELPKE